MTIAFTLCSNNFLAQAKTLTDSLKEYHPEMVVFLFLVDEKSPLVDYEFIRSAEVIVVNGEIVPGYREMVRRYGILELNSDLKPHLFQYLVKRFPGAAGIYYFDADTRLYDRLDHVSSLLGKEDIVATPHFLAPVPANGAGPFETIALRYGTYNMGFLAVNPASGNTMNFLKWWGERTRHFGFNDVASGFFVDQLWVNLAPVFFDKVHTLKHRGYNMAPWNLHEREIRSYEEKKVVLSTGERLVFYHFSSFDPARPGMISSKYGRRQVNDIPSLRKLYADYTRDLRENRVESFSKIACSLPVNEKKISRVRRMLYPVKVLLKNTWKKI